MEAFHCGEIEELGDGERVRVLAAERLHVAVAVLEALEPEERVRVPLVVAVRERVRVPVGEGLLQATSTTSALYVPAQGSPPSDQLSALM